MWPPQPHINDCTCQVFYGKKWMQQCHNDLWVRRLQVCGLHICLWVFPFRSHSFYFPNILMPPRQIKPLFFSSSKNIFLVNFSANSLDVRVKFIHKFWATWACDHTGKNDAVNKQPPKLQWWLAWSLLLCCIGGYRSLLCIEAKMSFPLEEQTLRKPAVRPSCGWKRSCGGGGVATN